MPVCPLFFRPLKSALGAMFPKLSACQLGFVATLIAFIALGQSSDDTVRVTVTMNPDGSKTVYQTDGANQSTATTTGADGKTRGKIIYQLDAGGRYESGQVFAPDGKLRFKTRYRYDS